MTDNKTAATDFRGRDTDQVILHPWLPRRDPVLRRLRSVLILSDHVRMAFHHDAPGNRSVGVESVCLQRNGPSFQQSIKFGARTRPENHCPIFWQVIHRKDLRTCAAYTRQPAH